MAILPNLKLGVFIMTKLVIITGIAADKFAEKVSQPILALFDGEHYGILGTTDGASDESLLAEFKENIGDTEDSLPPTPLWPIFFQGVVTADSEDLKGTESREVYDFSAAA
ncbi:hypothetical protein ACLPAF_02585 [Proteus mirabilis]